MKQLISALYYILKQLISALYYIHSRKIIHRDLKLDNIMVNFDSEFDKLNLNMMKGNKYKNYRFWFC